MSQSREEEEPAESDEKSGREEEGEERKEEEEEEKELRASVEEPSPGPPPPPPPLQNPNSEPGPKQESWLWNWLPFPLLSGFTWLGDRPKAPQEPVCCRTEGKRPSSSSSSSSVAGMCPDCEVTFCPKCRTLHYSRGFIEHGLLGHPPLGARSPSNSAGSLDVTTAAEEMEAEEEAKGP
ncbi:uncharacterized protein C17orf50 homolog [Anolis carolinensis]|uniref:uncharacterized protein C17orf50 homolog n=1 Tax=Anolis carolinensis TaxID=28377 RepID=UPI002F2B49BA